MKKIRSLSNAKIDEISALIGASFWDYPYEKGEGGLKLFCPLTGLIVAGFGALLG